MKRKIQKAIGAVLLAVAIAVTQIPAADAAAASDFQMNGDILVKYTGTASAVSVPAGTKEIAAEAFLGCQTMATVQIPKTVEKIGASAFRGCSALTGVEIPEGCQEIASQAFADCTSLTQFSMPASLDTLGSGVFAGDKKLAAVQFDIGNKHFVCRDGVIYNDDLTKIVEMLQGRVSDKYTMPATVTDVEKYAFWGCQGLKEITLSNFLEEIPAYAFSYCRGLERITIPYSVTQIQAKAFENCRQLTDTVIPASVRYIHDTAFDGCPKLNIISEAGSPAERFFAQFDASDAAQADYEENEAEAGSVSLEKGKTPSNSSDVSNYSPSDVSNATVVEVPDSADVIGRTKIVYNQAVVFVDNSKVKVLGGNEPVYSTDGEASSVSANEVDSSLEEEIVNHKYTIVNGDTVADKAYYGKEELTSYEFPNGIKSVGDFSFARSGLNRIVIPVGVNHIGYGAFYHCDNLQSVSIPPTVTEIEPAAFGHTPWLSNWYSGSDVDDFLVVGDGILIAYKGTKQAVNIPSNVKKIGAEVFQNHSEIRAVYLPDALVEIGEDAFSGCENLTQVSGGNRVEKICDRAFYGCPIQTIRITPDTKSIGLNAYAGSSAVEAVVFQGNELPQLSYEKTATRLSNDDYRDLALNGVTCAVVNGTVKNFAQTILDQNTLGFRGIVVSIQTEPTDASYGSVRLEYCTLEPDQATGVVNVPDSVRIFGKEYRLTSVSDTAFSPYSDYESWVKNKPTGISINSAITGGRNVAANLTLADTAGVYTKTVSDNSAHIQISNENKVFRESDLCKAEFRQLQDDFYLHFSKDETSENRLKTAVEEKYGALGSGQIFSFEMKLFDKTDKIPITRLGKEPMIVTMSIPPGMQDDTLCMVCLDQNGQLETGFVNYVSVDGETCIQFEVTHFSPYGIYAASGELADKINMKLSNSSSGDKKDDSPDTGDYLDPKWFLAGGCVFLALFLLIWKK